MPSFEGDMIRRREMVREQAAQQSDGPPGDGRWTGPDLGPVVEPVLVQVLWLEASPRRRLGAAGPALLRRPDPDAPLPELHPELRGVAVGEFGPTLLAVTDPEQPRPRCVACGMKLGYALADWPRTFDNQPIRAFEWRLMALVRAAGPGSEGSCVTSMCEAHAPDPGVPPWPTELAPVGRRNPIPGEWWLTVPPGASCQLCHHERGEHVNEEGGDCEKTTEGRMCGCSGPMLTQEQARLRRTYGSH